MTESAGARVRDVVCGMEIEPLQAAVTVSHAGQNFYFCSEQCAQRFRADLERNIPLQPAEPAQPFEKSGPPQIAETSPLTVGAAETEQPVPALTTGVPAGARVVSVDLPIEQLDCAECARRVEDALRVVPGVRRSFVNPDSGIARVIYDRQKTGLPELTAAVHRAGYLVGSTEHRIGIKGMT